MGREYGGLLQLSTAFCLRGDWVSDSIIVNKTLPNDGNLTIRRPIASPDYVWGNRDNGGTRTKRPTKDPRTSERRLTTAAEGSVVPHVYGRDQIAGKVYAVGYDSYYWYIGVSWCIGGTLGIAAIEHVFNGEEVIPSSDRQDYLGLPDQDFYHGATGNFGFDQNVYRNWLARSIPLYEDTMTTELLQQKVGVAHSIIRIAQGSEIQNLSAQINGILVKDYRLSVLPQDPEEAWIPNPLYNQWSDYSSGAASSYFEISDAEVVVQGTVQGGLSETSTVAFVPPKYREREHRIFSIPSVAGSSVRLDVRGDGALVSPIDSANSRLSLAWNSFCLYFEGSGRGWTDFSLNAGWENRGLGYAGLSYKSLPSGAVHIKGVVKNTSGTPYVSICPLPAELVPEYTLPIFCASYTSGSEDGFSRVDLNTSGELIPISGAQENWMSVETVYVPSSDRWVSISTLPGTWENYGGGYPPMQYIDLGKGLVHVRGMIKNGATGDAAQTLFTLPSGMRPYDTVCFNAFQGDGKNFRVQVLSGGEVQISYLGDSTFVWISFVFRAATGIWTYSESSNPTLALCDHIESKPYGAGARIGSASMASDCAEYNDEFIIADENVAPGTAPNDTRRHQIGYSMTRIDTVQKYIDVLRDYANCFTQYFGDRVFLVPDKKLARTGSGGNFSFDDFVAAFDDSNIIDGSLKSKKAGDRDRPTVVSVDFTDTSQPEGVPPTQPVLWRDGVVRDYYSGDVTQVRHWKEARLSYPGIQSSSQATRKLIEYMNHLWLEDLEVAFETFSDALPVFNGSPILLKHKTGIGSNLDGLDGYKPFRALRATLIGPNKYRVECLEYQDEAYSDVLVVTPTIPDTRIPDPSSAAEIVGVSHTELSSNSAGAFYTYFILDIQIDPDYPYPELQVYDWSIFQQTDSGLLLVWSGTAGSQKQFTSGPLVPEATYVVQVTSRNQMSGKRWPQPYTVTVLAVGKDNPPGTPVDFSASEAGGNIYLEWSEPDDEFPGTLSYEIRIISNPSTPMPVTDSDKQSEWATAEGFFSGSVLSTWRAGFPGGTYRFFIAAKDVFGTLSDVPAVLDVVSTSDDKAFVHDIWNYDYLSASGVYQYKPRRNSGYIVAFSNTSEVFRDVFPLAMQNYTAELYRYYNSVLPQVKTLDLGDYDGNPTYNKAIEFPSEFTGKFSTRIDGWVVSPPYVAGTIDTSYASASVETHLLLNGEAPPGTTLVGPNAENRGSARRVYAQAKGYCFKFRLDTARLESSFSTMKEEGQITTDGLGGTVVALVNSYVKAYKVNAQIIDNATTATGVIDNVSLNPNPASISEKTDISFSNGDGTTGLLSSTTTDFIAEGFSSDPDSDPGTKDYILVSGSGIPGNNRLYEVVSVNQHSIYVTPAPSDESASAPISVEEKSTITIFAKHSITGEDVVREVFWFFEGL